MVRKVFTPNGAQNVIQSDAAGNRGFVGLFGDPIVTIRKPDILIQFQYNIATADITSASSGTGAVALVAKCAEVSSGTGVGAGSIQSIRSIRYRPGREGIATFTAAFTAGEANSKQTIGPHNASSGYWVGYNNSTFGFGYRYNTTDTFVPMTSFNGDTDIAWLDPTKLNIYRINYGYLGIAPVSLWVHGGAKRSWVLLNQVDLTNTQTTTIIDNPTLPIRASSARTSGTGTALKLKTASWDGSALGMIDENTGARHFGYSNSKAVSSATLTNLFTLKSVATFQSVTNQVESCLELLNMVADGTKNTEIRIYKNATLAGSPSYANIDATNSVIQVDTAGTTVSGGTLLSTFFLGKTESRTIDIAESDMCMYAGETLTFAAYSTANTDAGVSIRWHEYF